MKKFKNITTCPTENDVFLFINMATTSVPSKHAPNFITNPTPIPRSNPPNTVAKRTSFVSSGTGLSSSNKRDNK
jgi:hypothetical protein